MTRLVPLLAFTATAACAILVGVVGAADYGVDCSFPIHSNGFSCGDILGDRKAVYDEFMDGCRERYGRSPRNRCDSNEEDRIKMSVRQPQSMVNYTSTGFKKIRAPKRVMELLTKHWQTNRDDMKQEVWAAGNIYVNHWASPTYMVSVEDNQLRGGGYRLKKEIWNAAKETIEEWTGMEQKPTSMYGIRVYTEGAILSPHADRLPLVSSAIVNVDQDVDEDWILEVYDREGNAVNVTMEPGDMVLYESGSLIHGRPFAMKGRYYANIFIHFEPTGRPLGDKSDNFLDDLDDFLPPYLIPGSPEISSWIRSNPNGWDGYKKRKPSPSAAIQQMKASEGHHAAATGDIDRIVELSKSNKRLLHKKDENGWIPLHEAVRSGFTDIVELLIKNGADKNARTGIDGKGESPLNIAMTFHGEDDPVTEYLISIGAKDIEPDEL